jgi:rubredoxin
MKIAAKCPECGQVFQSDDGRDERGVMPPGMGIEEHDANGERCAGSGTAAVAEYVED